MTGEIPAGMVRVECSTDGCDRHTITNKPDDVDKCVVCRDPDDV
jgi:hypothetical protein